MARIRTIKPEFWTSEKITECSLSARLLFIGLWNFSDDEGRMEDKPRQIKMRVFPGDDLDVATVDAMLSELAIAGLLVRYEAQGKRFIQVLGWDHQRINRPLASKFPAPSLSTHGGLTEQSQKIMPEPDNSEPDNSDSSEGREVRATRSPAPKTKTGTRLPDTFPSKEHFDEALRLGCDPPHAESEAAKFRDYWAEVPGQRGRKVDWMGTWRNWIRRSLEDGRIGNRSKGEQPHNPGLAASRDGMVAARRARGEYQ